jgi:hypothetical protein
MTIMAICLLTNRTYPCKSLHTLSPLGFASSFQMGFYASSLYRYLLRIDLENKIVSIFAASVINTDDFVQLQQNVCNSYTKPTVHWNKNLSTHSWSIIGLQREVWILSLSIGKQCAGLLNGLPEGLKSYLHWKGVSLCVTESQRAFKYCVNGRVSTRGFIWNNCIRWHCSYYMGMWKARITHKGV